MDEIRRIDMADWTQFSSRRNSTSYVSSDGRWMLKASSESNRFTIGELQREIDISVTAAAMGIRTPKAYEVVMLPDGGCGAIFENIKDKKSFSRASSEDLSRINEIARLYADMAKELHTLSADPARMVSFEDRLKGALDHTAQYSEMEKNVLLEAAYRRSGKAFCLQGDFQPSNIILSPQGCYFIDLGMLSYGDPLYDIGFLWYIVKMSNARVYDRIFHADKETVELFWQRFAGYYFETDDIASVEKKVAPYGCISTNLMLSVMPNTGFIANNKEMIFSLIK